MQLKRIVVYSAVAVLGLVIPGTAGATPMAGVSDGTTLIGFDSATPGIITGTRIITGLQAGETIVGIDTRPADGLLYGIGSSSRLYVISTGTGAATQVGTGPFAPTLSGTSFGMDFNPTVDRIRVVSNAQQNFRLNPSTGALTATDSAINPAGSVVGAAYSNDFVGATSSTIYVINSGTDSLYTLGSPGGTPLSPNSGTLLLVGALGVDTSDQVGFDIIGAGTALASLTSQTGSALYSINLTTGAASLIGNMGAPSVGSISHINGPILGTRAVPALSRLSLVVLGLGLLALGAFTRRRRSVA